MSTLFEYLNPKKEEFSNVADTRNYIQVRNAPSMAGADVCVSFEPTVGVGALGAHVAQTESRSPTYMSWANNIKSKEDCNSEPIGNPHRQDKASGVILQNWYVNETERGNISPSQVEQVNPKGQEKWNNLSFLDPQKVTVKETNEFAYVGNAQRESDGTEFYTYKDAPKVRKIETTEFAYVGNAQRESDGTEFWTYKDDPKVTKKETQEFAYVGNAQREGNMTTSYNQYTGFNNSPDKDSSPGIKTKTSNGMTSKVGGADTYTIRGSTLVQNWVAPAGRQNLRQDAEGLQGKINFGTFGWDENFNGPGTLRQAIPDATSQQYKVFLATPRPNINRMINVDTRQIAGYQVNQLQNNPLSIYTVNPDAPIPGFECLVEPSEFSTMVNERKSKLHQPDEPGQSGWSDGKVVEVYPVKSTRGMGGVMDRNPNSDLVYNVPGPLMEESYERHQGSKFQRAQVLESFNMANDNDVNQFLVHQYKDNSEPIFSGHCYSGLPNLDQRITIGGPDEPSVYGPLERKVEIPSGMAQGIQNPVLQRSQDSNNPRPVSEGNKALNFATNTLFLESVSA